MRLSRTRSFLFCSSIALAIGLFGASASGSTLSSTISDSSRKVIPGAKATATNMATNVTSGVETDKAGLYVIPNLVPGVYQFDLMEFLHHGWWYKAPSGHDCPSDLH